MEPAGSSHEQGENAEGAGGDPADLSPDPECGTGAGGWPAKNSKGKPFTRHDALRMLGFNKKQLDRVDTFTRLTRLTGVFENDPSLGKVGEADRKSVAAELEEIVLNGHMVDDITSARERCAQLLTCAVIMRDEASYLIDNPAEAEALCDWDKDVAYKVRDELLGLCGELEARAGQPEPMKTAAAEKMRCKLEKRLVPKLKNEIPKWAERLRYLHAQVLRWQNPAPLLRPDSPTQDLPKPVVHEMKEWEAPKEFNPEPEGEELELLRRMGWGASQ